MCIKKNSHIVVDCNNYFVVHSNSYFVVSWFKKKKSYT